MKWEYIALAVVAYFLYQQTPAQVLATVQAQAAAAGPIPTIDVGSSLTNNLIATVPTAPVNATWTAPASIFDTTTAVSD